MQLPAFLLSLSFSRWTITSQCGQLAVHFSNHYFCWKYMELSYLRADYSDTASVCILIEFTFFIPRYIMEINNHLFPSMMCVEWICSFNSLSLYFHWSKHICIVVRVMKCWIATMQCWYIYNTIYLLEFWKFLQWWHCCPQMVLEINPHRDI